MNLLSDLDEKLKAAFGEALNYTGDGFSDALSPEDVPNWDSLGHLRLVTALQEKFGVEFDVDEIMRMEDVGKIKQVLADRNVS
jgi:acyl carrier protein